MTSFFIFIVMKKINDTTAILLIDCPDKKGIVTIITEFIYKNKGNIIHLDQHVDSVNDHFFMRIEWELDEFIIPKDKIGEYFKTLIAEQNNMNWQLHFSDQKPRLALYVTKSSHCLYDILSRVKSDEWDAEIPLIISNHTHLKHVADRFEIPFYHMEITKQNKAEQEKKQIELLTEHNIDLIILARYMQIVSNDFINNYPNRIINIHHSFLPAFPGAKPYHSAYERGVKIIGATSHYVTAELDAGPIIEQDIIRVNHKHDVEELIRKGKDLEKLVLSRGVWHHLKHRVIVHNNRTVVF